MRFVAGFLRAVAHVALTGLATGLVACTGGGPTNALEDLSGSDRVEIANIVSSLEEEVNFRVLLPTYLPAGLDPVPTPSVIEDGRVAVLIFRRDQNNPDAEPGSLPILKSILLEQGMRTGGGACPSDCASGPDATAIDVKGHPGTEKVSGGSTQTFHALHFDVKNIFVALSVEWSTNRQALTDEMREEGMRIAESMTEQ